MSPFHHTLAQLASLATIRGNVAEAEIWSRAIDLVRAHHIESEPDAGLFRVPPDYTRQELPVRYGSQLTSKPLSPAVRIKP